MFYNNTNMAMHWSETLTDMRVLSIFSSETDSEMTQNLKLVFLDYLTEKLGLDLLQLKGKKIQLTWLKKVFSSPYLLMKATGSSLLGTKSPEWITSSGSLSVATIS